MPAWDAYACLLNPEFDKPRSKKIYDQIRKFSQILSSQAFYRNPEKVTLKINPVDLNKTLDIIEKKIDEETYGTEYEFSKDLIMLFGEFHDGHTYFATGCALVFGQFIHDYPLVSIVDPGTNALKVFLFNSTTGDVEEEIVEIAGQTVIQHLLDLVQNLKGPYDAIWIDEDARWNGLFGSMGVMGLDLGNFASRDLYPGADFTMKTKSGNVIKVQWYVSGPVYWADKSYFAKLFESTESYYNEWCLVSPNAQALESSNAAAPHYQPNIHTNIISRLHK